MNFYLSPLPDLPPQGEGQEGGVNIPSKHNQPTPVHDLKTVGL